MTLRAGATAPTTDSMSRPMTIMVSAGSSGCSASMTWRIIGCPAISWRTLGRVDLRRVPSPAARMMAAKRDWLMTNETRSWGLRFARGLLPANTQIVAQCDWPGAELTTMAHFLLVFDLDGTL